MIEIIDSPVPGDITFKLSPETQYDVKWEDTATFYVTVENNTDKPIEDFNLKVTMSDNLKSPLTAINTTSKLTITSNMAGIYLSQEKIEVTKSQDGKKLYIENKGTIDSKAFSYKYEAPSNTVFSSALLNGNIFNNISHVKLGKYFIFKIKSLPISTPSDNKILIITFN